MSFTKHEWTKTQQRRVARLARLDAILANEYGVITPNGRDCNVRAGDTKPHNIYCAVKGTVGVPDRAISILKRRKALAIHAW